jgi:transcriptional regulator with XRE-family HTH domain
MYGEFIKKHRLLSGYKRQNQLANATGISTATISRIENEIQIPEVRTLKTLSFYLHTTTLKELMDACGYDVEFDESSIVIGLTDDKYLFEVDGEVLTGNELKGILAYVRSIRDIK